MKTLLLSTSSLWNCGDDFIREGVCELLQLKPEVRTLWWNRAYGVSGDYANSLKVNLPLIDYFVVAGTPQWIFKNERIYRFCLKHQIPLSIIGVGGDNAIDRSHHALMKSVSQSGLCEVALARDTIALNALHNYGFDKAALILDPAFFLRKRVGNPRLNVIGWRNQFSFEDDPQFLRQFPHKALYRAAKHAVLDRRPVISKRAAFDSHMLDAYYRLEDPKMVIVHDNREIARAEELFGRDAVFYSTDYLQILARYANAKTYVGSRIHGAIPSLIHGATVQLMYASRKAQVIEDALGILSKYDSELPKSVSVEYLFGGKKTGLDSAPKAVNIPNLSEALEAEKRGVRLILRTQKCLGTLIE